MATGDGTALVLIRHAGIDRAKVADVLHRRWPDAIVGNVRSLSPSWEFAIEDAVELACARRGVEPLRIVVLPQRVHHPSGAQPVTVEPMPVLL
jgi:hypothetical protein